MLHSKPVFQSDPRKTSSSCQPCQPCQPKFKQLGKNRNPATTRVTAPSCQPCQAILPRARARFIFSTHPFFYFNVLARVYMPVKAVKYTYIQSFASCQPLTFLPTPLASYCNYCYTHTPYIFLILLPLIKCNINNKIEDVGRLKRQQAKARPSLRLCFLGLVWRCDGHCSAENTPPLPGYEGGGAKKQAADWRSATKTGLSARCVKWA